MPISFVDAPCGSGKSFGMIHEIKANYDQLNYLVAVNSYDHQLIWREDLIKAGIAKDSITLVSCYEKENVLPQILKVLKESPRHGQILIITHAAYNLMPYLPRRPWKIVIDEVSECQWFYELSVSVDALKDLAEVENEWPPNPDLVVLKPIPKTNIGRRIKGVGKTGDMGLVRLLHDLKDKRRTVLVTKKQWENSKKEKTIGFLSVYNFASHHDKHHDVTFLAANFKESFPYQIAAIQGAKLRERTLGTLDGRRFGKRDLRIEYSIDRLPSKRFFNFKSEGRQVKEVLHENLVKDWADKEFLYVLNKDDGGLESGQRLQFTEIKGVNTKTAYDRIYFGAAINLKPHHYNLLSLYGIDRTAANRAVALELSYQAVMRTSLRDPKSKNPVVIRVPSKIQAEYLQSVIGFGDVVNLEERPKDPLPKRRYETAINNWVSMLDNLPSGRLTKGQNRKWQNEIWRIMCGMARAGSPHSYIRTICLDAAGNNQQLQKHVEYEMPRLKRWCSKQQGMPGTEGLEEWK